jgi:hypothetical protein
VGVNGDFKRLDLAFQTFVLGFELVVILDELLDLFADLRCVTGGAPGFLAAVVNEPVAVLLLLLQCERHSCSIPHVRKRSACQGFRSIARMVIR